jgi:hypothetical protein
MRNWSFRLRNLNDRLAIAEFVPSARPGAVVSELKNTRMRTEWFTASAALCVVCRTVDWGELCVCCKSSPLPHCDAGDPAVESEERRSQAFVGALSESFVTPVRYVH